MASFVTGVGAAVVAEDVVFRDTVSGRGGVFLVATVAIENLLVMKALAGRPQDEQDIRGLVAAQRETIDCPACLDLAEKLGEAVCLDLAGRACPCPLAGRSPRPFGQISGVGLPPSIKALDASRGTPRGSGSHRLCKPGSPNGPGIAEWTGVPSLALRAFIGVTPSRSRRRAGGDGGKESPSLALRAFIGVTPSRSRRRAGGDGGKESPSLTLRAFLNAFRVPSSIQHPQQNLEADSGSVGRGERIT